MKSKLNRSSRKAPSGTPGDGGAALRALSRSSYASFRRQLASSGCQLCPLADARQHIVVDRGRPGAALLLIGEAPGREEDESGRAFVGRSGRLLDRMLAEAGWDPESDVIIANVIKCRPPDNRPPRRGEVEQCLPFLLRQIELLKPQQIGLLGATAVKHVLGLKQPMNDLAGTVLDQDQFPEQELMVLFHPSYILRFPNRHEEMVGWLKNLRQRGGRRTAPRRKAKSQR